MCVDTLTGAEPRSVVEAIGSCLGKFYLTPRGPLPDSFLQALDRLDQVDATAKDAVSSKEG